MRDIVSVEAFDRIQKILLFKNKMANFYRCFKFDQEFVNHPIEV